MNGATDADGVADGVGDGDGVADARADGVADGVGDGVGVADGLLDGLVDGLGDGVGVADGLVDGLVDGTGDGEGVLDGTVVGAAAVTAVPPLPLQPPNSPARTTAKARLRNELRRGCCVPAAATTTRLSLNFDIGYPGTAVLQIATRRRRRASRKSHK
jgi:hypothetical protein